jgi:tight adherence protein B
MNAAQLLNLIILIAVGLLVFSIWCFCVFVWLTEYLFRLKKIKKRLGATTAESEESKILRLWSDSRQDITEKTGKEQRLKEKLDKIAYEAGWQTSMQTILLGLAGFVLLVFLFTYLISNNIFLSLAAVLVVVFGFIGYTNNRISKREAIFEKQLVDALGIAARSLRAGHPLSGAFRLISEEIGKPLGDVFYRICQEQELGLDVKNSVRRVAEDTRNSELRLFATAVVIQLQSGGNLADLMDSLATVIRARIRLLKRVRVLTAQTNLSAKVLIAMPVVMFFALNILNPEYMSPLYETDIGQILLAATVVSVLFGWWVMRKLSAIRF